ncbi:MAG: class I SAM-dependent methyltransferase [Polymorphobacter sp.]|uniref:class I SAM-dependent methyltransferase n=1 Tax=Polymorphobacter sp. TaxID=1909290 RepID=UPI003A83BCF1
MTRHVNHALAVRPTRNERAAQDFTSSLRGHVLNHMAAQMKTRFETEIAPKLAQAPEDGRAVHQAMRPHPYFRFYSTMRIAAQEMVWASVDAAVRRDSERLKAVAAELPDVGGSLTLDPSLEVPRSVSAIDVHLMPGSYSAEAGEGDLAAGAVYENGLSVFSFGLMGKNLDDIGESSAFWLRHAHPEFQPKDILDLGCSVGHQTLPWARAYPGARVTGVDVAAPCLRYADGRARAQGVAAHFVQANATQLPFPDASFDLVYSSMFLHELPLKDIDAVFAEARRLLRPGGLMLHYELPPNSQLSAYDGFYLDWDCWYNNEPYYKAFRDQDPKALCAKAGFDTGKFVQTVVPSIGWYGEEAVAEAIAGPATIGGNTGRLADGVQWFVFGNWA